MSTDTTNYPRHRCAMAVLVCLCFFSGLGLFVSGLIKATDASKEDNCYSREFSACIDICGCGWYSKSHNDTFNILDPAYCCTRASGKCIGGYYGKNTCDDRQSGLDISLIVFSSVFVTFVLLIIISCCVFCKYVIGHTKSYIEAEQSDSDDINQL